ncbi:matrixin family metalloprotease [Streptosporangium canum]|uniref:matrixin family metalloprotease n=1 Tax=Streptosporangium canum TaxID=324952 RepID=UPI0037B1BC49
MSETDFLDEIRAHTTRIMIDGEIFWKVEGDYILDDDQLLVYSMQRASLSAQQRASQLANNAGFGDVLLSDWNTIDNRGQGLVGIMQNSRIVRWTPGTLLTYCVLSQTFPRLEWYKQAVTNMERATADWEDTCGIKFQYQPDLDDSDDLRPAGAVFPVRFIDAGGAFIAAAFFPNDPLNRRRLLIDPSYFSETLGYNPVGVLRHELGHVLGFRHEQIRSLAPPICPDEDTEGTLDLTAYDPKSVMHYFCGGVGSRDLDITQLDRDGSQKVYGQPLDSFELLHP